jgi:hypothetical protein
MPPKLDNKPKKYKKVRKLRLVEKDDAFDDLGPTPEEIAAEEALKERHEMLSHLVLIGGVWRYQEATHEVSDAALNPKGKKPKKRSSEDESSSQDPTSALVGDSLLDTGPTARRGTPPSDSAEPITVTHAETGADSSNPNPANPAKLPKGHARAKDHPQYKHFFKMGAVGMDIKQIQSLMSKVRPPHASPPSPRARTCELARRHARPGVVSHRFARRRAVARLQRARPSGRRTARGA